MRNTTYSGVTIKYPDDIIWTGDHVPVSLSAGNKVGATLTITHPNGAQKQLSYMSSLNDLTFYIDTTLRAMYDGNISNYRCEIEIFVNETSIGTFSFYFKLYEGKSFQDRTHGTSQYIYIYNALEATKIKIYSPCNGTAIINGNTFTIARGINSLNLSSIITDSGIYTIRLFDSNEEELTAQIISDTPISPEEHQLDYEAILIVSNPTYGGNVFGSKWIFPIIHTIELVDACDDYTFGELIYTDCDGCERCLAGTIVSDTTNVSKTSFTRLEGIEYKNVPNDVLNSSTQMIKIHFSAIDKNANYRDILYANDIRLMRKYDGELIPVKLKTNSIDVKASDDAADFDLEIYYMS